MTVAARYAKKVDNGTGVTRSAVSVPASTSSRTRNARQPTGDDDARQQQERGEHQRVVRHQVEVVTLGQHLGEQRGEDHDAEWSR